MNRSLKITLLMDAAWLPGDDPQLAKDDLTPLTERHVTVALRGLGHEVRIVGVSDDVGEVVTAVTGDPPDLVFNLVEEFRHERRLDKDVAGLLELLGVPFTGSGTEGLMLCRDKALCKELLGLHKIQCPAFVRLPPNRRVRLPRNMSFPLIVKPRLGDASEGVVKASVVKNEEELLARVRDVHEQWQQTAIAEQYVEGRELYVSVLGNKRRIAFPPRELFFGNSANNAPRIATSRVKCDPAYRDKWNIEYGFASLAPEVARMIAKVARRACHLLRVQDYGRVDLRLTPENKIKVLEINANPDIAYGEDFAESAEKGGLTYEQLIDRIVNLALRRHEDQA